MLAKDQIEIIRNRQDKLAAASIGLKSHFCGLDDIIDRIMKSIEVWYIMPELMTRPMVVNLWGLTGVGKTDLVRRLVRLLEFSDRYCEIELTNDGCPAHPFAESVSSILASATLRPGVPGVLLLDEIQRFRTIDQHDEEVRNYKFQDVWTLLGDGRMPHEIDSDYLLKMVFATNLEKDLGKKPKGKKKLLPRGVPNSLFDEDAEDDDVPSFYAIKRFKEVLRLEDSLETIASWTHEQKMKTVFRKIEDKSIYDHLDYTKLLIFVSGNIDEAYTFAKQAEEADVDADIFHQQSQQINILDIKTALKKRFRPEQIARFGNVHVIYPALNRASYEQIISRRIDSIVEAIVKNHNVELVIDSSVHRLIYDNGVFPVQGTRPVLSTISDAFENSLPSILLQSLLENSKKLEIKAVDGKITGMVKDKLVVSIPFVGALDRLREEGRNKVDQRVKTSVHEAGHGLVYGLLFKTAPVHISANAIASDHDGYVGCHNLSGSKEMLHNDICVCLAGAVAEQIVFGEDYQTSGNESDLAHATSVATSMVRRYGMMDCYGKVVSEMSDEATESMVNIQDTNDSVRRLLRHCKEEVHKLISENHKLLISIVDSVCALDVLTPAQVHDIFKQHGIEIDVKPPREILTHDYQNKYHDFVKSKK